AQVGTICFEPGRVLRFWRRGRVRVLSCWHVVAGVFGAFGPGGDVRFFFFLRHNSFSHVLGGLGVTRYRPRRSPDEFGIFDLVAPLPLFFFAPVFSLDVSFC
ncbi:unnamed protein product, partial [Ectocarpus fasciculatus]